MSVTYVQDKSSTAFAASVVATFDSAPTEGNLLIAFYSVRGTTNTSYTGPSGWTQLGTHFVGPSFDGGLSAIWYKVASASESATVTIMVGASGTSALYIAEIAGASSIDAYDQADSETASTTMTAGPVTVGSETYVLAAFTQSARNTANGGTDPDFTYPAGWTRRYQRQVHGSGPAVCFGTKDATTTGSTSVSVTATNNDGYGWMLFSLTVDPVPSGTYIDWDEDGFSPGTDDQIGPYVGSWRISRGASPEITGGAMPGAATLVLRNPSDDRFNPLNTSSPIYGKLRDGVPVWLSVNSDGASTGSDPRGLFGGRTTDITPLPVGGASVRAFVEIACEDALGWYGRTPCRIADAMFRSQGAFRELVMTTIGETRYSARRRDRDDAAVVMGRRRPGARSRRSTRPTGRGTSSSLVDCVSGLV